MRARAEKIRTDPPRGTRDFPPEEHAIHAWLLEQWRAVSRLFGYEEWAAPVVEHEGLYTRKQGEEIVQQLYSFEDKGGRRLALRPELTPSLARLALQKGRSLPMPAKWFSIGQCWRYERATRGRRREHYQWNMDVLGSPSQYAEAELLAAIATFLQRVGLSSDDVGIRISSRNALSELLQAHSLDPSLLPQVAVAVDRGGEEAGAELSSLGIPSQAVDSILAAISANDLHSLASLLGESSPAVSELTSLLEACHHHGLDEWVQIDPSVVRGLAYYTGPVFEGFDRDAHLRAIFGGGRYDRLLSTFGGEDTPAAGFGFGDAVIMELLREKGLLPGPFQTCQDVVAPLVAGAQGAAAEAASKLRQQGRSAELALEAKRPKWAFKRADQLLAERVVLIGERELSHGSASIKDLSTGDQFEVAIDSMQ